MTPVVTASTPSATDNEVARLSTDIPVQALRQKLSQIRDATNGINRKHEIQQQLNRIEPYLDEARAIVIRATDAEFQAIADQMKAKMKPLDEAIADIQKISTASRRRWRSAAGGIRSAPPYARSTD